MRKWILRLLYGALVMLPVGAIANYAVTVGAGTNFGSVVIGGTVHFASMLVCDFVTANQCAAVKAASTAPVATDPALTVTLSQNAGLGAAATPMQVSLANTTANATAVKTDGSAVTQPVSGTVTANAGTNLNTSTLATAANQATNTATSAHTCSVAGFSELGCLGQIDDDVKSPIPAGTARIGYTSDDACSQKAKTNLPISQNGTASVQLIALSGATVIYVCSLSLIAAGATTVALTTGTGAACVTGNAAVIGTTTALIANSMSLAANGGLTLGSGAGTIAQGAASSELCMVLGTNVFVAGNLTYVQQ